MKKLLALILAVPLVVTYAVWYVQRPPARPLTVGTIPSGSGADTQSVTGSAPANAAAGTSAAAVAAVPEQSVPTRPSPKPPIDATVTADQIVTADGTRYPLRHYSTLSYNDPRASQWWTATTNMQRLWDAGPGTYVPTIAVIDTGFALGHEELAGRWALNAADPVNGIDDDGDGYVDDWRGWDFAYGDNDPQAGTVNPAGDGTMHGTMTAGAAAATGNNGKGIAGVSQTAKILPVQVMDDDASGNSYTVGRGVIFAADHHADVISISLGTTADDPYMRAATDYAIGKGSVVVASAGNDGSALAYPAAYPEVVAVGSVGRTGTPSSFSNYGDALDILAPGEDMTLPAWGADYPTNGYVSGAAGTSFSAPLVAGTLASLKALAPSSTGGELVAAIKETADHKTLTAAAPHSASLGFGVLDAGAAAARVTTAPTPQQRTVFTPITSGDVLGSARTYQCAGSDYPSAELFEIDSGAAKDARYSYTISDTDVIAARSAGQAVRSLGYQCVGQAADRPSSVRLLNLNREIH